MIVRAVLACVLLWLATSVAWAEEARPRLLVLTDIGGDPDDTQSLIRLLLFSNHFEIEGFIASASGTPGELKEQVTRADLIRQVVEAYGQVRPRLVEHADGYPEANELLERIKSGNSRRGRQAIGAEHDTEGSRWIIEVADRQDERPLHITIWGGQTDLAQALWRVREERGADGLKTFLARLRVYDIDDQDDLQGWLFENFPDLFYVLSKSPPGRDKREGGYRGMYLDGDVETTSLAWLDAHVRRNHGPLGALYPPRTWTEPNPHGALKEGDTPSWFYFLPHGLQDPAHPEWGGWGGRFRHVERGLWRDAADTAGGKTSARATVFRWRPVFQAAFQARLDWCVQPKEKANHAPQIVLDEQMVTQPVVRRAKAGTKLTLDASASRDPDGDRLAMRWWVYREAGTYGGDWSLESADAPRLEVTLPQDGSGKTVHLVLEVTDNGTPALTTQQRIVVEME